MKISTRDMHFSTGRPCSGDADLKYTPETQQHAIWTVFFVIHPEKFSSKKRPETKFFFPLPTMNYKKRSRLFNTTNMKTNEDPLKKGTQTDYPRVFVDSLTTRIESIFYLGQDAATSDRVGLWHCESHRRLMSNPQMLMVKRLGFDGERCVQMRWNE